MFDIRFDGTDNILEIFNVSQYPGEINAPVKLDVEPKKYNKVFTDLGLNVLKPINDGEDFIYVYVGTSIAKNELYSFDSLIGRSFGDVYPYFKEYFFPVFREVLNTGDRRDILTYFYEGKDFKRGIELKVLLNEEDNEIFFFMENKTEMYELRAREKNNFELSTLPKSIVQNGRIVKINRAHELLTNTSIDEANKLTMDDFNVHKIVYNDTGLVLNYSQIMEKVLNNEYPQIIYNMVVDTYEKPRRMQGLARHITFKGAPAAEFTVLRELEEFDAELEEFTQGKMDLIQKISKTAFLLYDVEDGSSTWGRSLEDILEGSIFEIGDVKEFFYQTLSDDVMDKVKSKMKKGVPCEGEVEIRTFKGNIKYIRYNLKPLYHEGKLVKWLQILTDITTDTLKNVELNTLKDVVEDVQEATALSVFYMKDNGKYVWTSEIYNIIERNPRLDDENHHILLDLISDEDRNKYHQLVENLEPNEFLGTNIFPLQLESGKTKIVEMNARKVYDNFGNFVRRLEYCRDITEEWNHERELIRRDAEKTVLIKEVHHRVKNNLQTITSLISLEERFKTRPSKILDITKSRISALTLIHETIYNESDMNYVNICTFFDDFDDNLISLAPYSDINFVKDIDDLTLYIDYVNPLVLMTNELTTNSFKHAFNKDDVNKEISKSISLYEEHGVKICKFHYKDNGKGLPEDFDINSSRNLGWTIIKSLVAQLDGDYEVFNEDGFNFVLTFPVVM